MASTNEKREMSEAKTQTVSPKMEVKSEFPEKIPSRIDKLLLQHTNVVVDDVDKVGVKPDYKLGEDTCRACLQQNEDMQSLFYVENNLKNVCLLDMFIACTSLKISLNDQYPKHICEKCMQELSQAFEFWTKCHNTVKQLDKISEKMKIVNDAENEIDVPLLKCETVITDSYQEEEYAEKPISKTTNYRKSRYILPTRRIIKRFNMTVRKPEAISEPDDRISKKIKKVKIKHTCTICDKSFSTAARLIRHNMTHKSEPTANAGGRKCRKCNIRFPTKQEYAKHAKTHNTFLCPDCGHISTSRSSFTAHASSHSSSKPYECKDCSKKYKSLSSLLVHRRNHTGERRYACEHCGDKFITWNSMKSHIRTHHTNERPYVCNVCSKSFKQSSTLIIHRRQHTGEKPYPCAECSMAFRSSSDLRGHMVKHTGERNYPCTVCEKRFARPYNLTQHMVTHTGERKHKCEICGRAFTQAHVLRGHMRTHGEQYRQPPQVTAE